MISNQLAKKIMRYVGVSAFLVLPLMAPAKSSALSFTFSDKDFLGGVSWGTMVVTAHNETSLKIQYNAVGTIPSGAQVTGFGFNFDKAFDSVTNPSSSDYFYDQDKLNWVKLTNLNAIPNPSNGDEFTPKLKKDDFLAGATEGQANTINPPGIKPGETDVFYLNFSGINFLAPNAPPLNEFINYVGIRLQSLPNDINGGSLFLAGKVNNDPEIPPVPEPATMLLFGTGLVGAAGVVSRRARKEKASP